MSATQIRAIDAARILGVDLWTLGVILRREAAKKLKEASESVHAGLLLTPPDEYEDDPTGKWDKEVPDLYGQAESLLAAAQACEETWRRNSAA